VAIAYSYSYGWLVFN